MSARHARYSGLCALTLLSATLFGCSEEGTTVPNDGGVGDAAVDAGGVTADPLEVTTTLGKVRGKQAGTTREFLGIPYAKPPVGALRFMPPQPAAPWSETRSATQFGPACPQPTVGLPAPGPYSEDCLTINVYTPADAKAGAKLPVLVWLYGGAFVTGGSSQYDGERLSREGPAVIVTLNYRLGALGLFTHPKLDEERGSTPSGNDALRDQQLALTFLRDNVAAFGGDPENVTLFGESAGSMSTCLQMVSPTGRALAARHIMQSASCVAGLPIERRPASDARGARLVERFCAGRTDPIACLRAQDATELANWASLDGISGAGWAPVINPNDPLLPKHPVTLLSETPSQKPMIIGTNKNEWALFVVLRGPQITTVDMLRSAIGVEVAAMVRGVDSSAEPQKITEITDDVVAHYATEQVTDSTAPAVFIRLMTDAYFRCPARGLAALGTARGQTVHLYSFEEGSAFHAADIGYVWGNPVPALGITDVEAVHTVFADYWLAFAETGDPNTAGTLTWPSWDATAAKHLVLKSTPEVGEQLADADCDFWDLVAPRILQI